MSNSSTPTTDDMNPAPRRRSHTHQRILDSVDPAERRRMIDEAAYERYKQRGFCDGFDVDDWLQAEAEVDDWIFTAAQAHRAAPAK